MFRFTRVAAAGLISKRTLTPSEIEPDHATLFDEPRRFADGQGWQAGRLPSDRRGMFAFLGVKSTSQSGSGFEDHLGDQRHAVDTLVPDHRLQQGAEWILAGDANQDASRLSVSGQSTYLTKLYR